MRRPLPPALLVLFATSAGTAAAAPGGHYVEAEIPVRSALFKRIGDSSAKAFEEVEVALKRTDGALAKMDLSLALLGSAAADPAQREARQARLDARSDTFAYEFSGVQARLDQVGAAFESAFAAALRRALTALTTEGEGASIEPCAPKRGALSALGAGPGEAPGSGCPGSDYTAEIARRWDRDATLEAQLLDLVGGEIGPLVVGTDGAGNPVVYGGELDGRGWPKLTAWSDPDDVLALGGQASSGPAWLHPADLVLALPELAEALDRVDALAAEARGTLSAAAEALPRNKEGALLPEGKERAGAIAVRAKGVRAFVADARAAIGAEVWGALAAARKKGRKDGWAEVGICVNPPAFGGCAGTDATDAVGGALAADKKLATRLAAATSALAAPSVELP